MSSSSSGMSIPDASQFPSHDLGGDYDPFDYTKWSN